MAFFEGIKMTAGYGDGPDIISSCNINANRGEIVAILGPNGAGKSTAMKAMLGLLTLKSGSVCLDGEDISKISPQDRVKKGISFVPQTRNVFAELTVRENLEIGGFLREDGLEEMINNIYELFPILKEKKSQIVGQLSGGQQQRVFLARALAQDAEIYLLDEPFSGVDAVTERAIIDVLKSLKSKNKSVIAVHHDLATVRDYFDYVLMINIKNIADFGFNMSKIESRPSKRELGEYIIYVDLEINNQNNIKNFLKLKNNLKPLCKNFVDFGNYFSENIELD